MIAADEALRRLREGNRRWVEGASGLVAATSPASRRAVAEEQQPFAVILGCSDSRVPPEVIFDQGLGDLFVVRVAGNVVTTSQLGSIEAAVEWFGIRLVIVLGHSRCGAILAGLELLQQGTGGPTGATRSILDPLCAAIVETAEEPAGDRETLVARAVRANVRASAGQLRGAEAFAPLIAHEGLRVVGAQYSLDTGVVDLFDGVPGAD